MGDPLGPTGGWDGSTRLFGRLLLFLGVALTVSLAVGAVLPFGGVTRQGAALLMGALAAGWLLLRLEGRGPGALGFHWAPSVPRELLSGVLLGVAPAVLVVGILSGSGGVAWAREGGSLPGWLADAGGAALLLALPAAAEEALLRGYPLQALARQWGRGRGLVVTSVLFGGIHGANPGATWVGTASVVAAGLFLGAVCLRTGSLWWASGAHLGWNWGIGYLADLPVSGVDVVDAPLVRSWPIGPAWWGGGAFGPEGSVMAMTVFLALAGLCWWGPWLRWEEAAPPRGLAGDEVCDNKETRSPRGPSDDRENEP